MDINDRGEVVGSSETRIGDAVFLRAVRWDPDGEIRSLGTFRSDGKADSRATAVNVRGTVVGSAETEDRVRRAFRWTKHGGLEDLRTISGSPEGDSIAYDVDDGGTVVGHSDTNDEEVRAFRWTDGDGMVDLGTLRGDGVSYAFDVNPRGTVVGRSYAVDGFDSRRAVRWPERDRDAEDLGTLGEETGYSEAHGVNARGDIVSVSRADEEGHAFRWTDRKGMEDLGTLLDGGGASTAMAVNARGDVVGSSETPDEEWHAVQWGR